MDPARQLAQLLERAAELLLGAAEQLLGAVGVLAQACLRQPHRQRQRDEPLLGAVVQVALEPPPLGRAGLDDAGARARAAPRPARAAAPAAARSRSRARRRPRPSARARRRRRACGRARSRRRGGPRARPASRRARDRRRRAARRGGRRRRPSVAGPRASRRPAASGRRAPWTSSSRRPRRRAPSPILCSSSETAPACTTRERSRPNRKPYGVEREEDEAEQASSRLERVGPVDGHRGQLAGEQRRAGRCPTTAPAPSRAAAAAWRPASA